MVTEFPESEITLAHSPNPLATAAFPPDIDECAEFKDVGEDGCPEPNEVCNDTIGSFTCECEEDYERIEGEGCKSVAITKIENTVRITLPSLRVQSYRYNCSHNVGSRDLWCHAHTGVSWQGIGIGGECCPSDCWRQGQ